jgi:hypothetical protein
MEILYLKLILFSENLVLNGTNTNLLACVVFLYKKE